MTNYLLTFVFILMSPLLLSATESGGAEEATEAKTCQSGLRSVTINCAELSEPEKIRLMESMNKRYKGVGSSVANQMNQMSDEQLRNAAALKLAAQQCKKATDECKTVCKSEYENSQEPVTREKIVATLKECTAIGEKVTLNKVSSFIDSVDSYDQLSGHADKMLGRKPEGFVEKNKGLLLTGGAIAGGAVLYNMGKKSGEDDGKKSAIANLRYNCFNEGKWDSPECKREYVAVCSENPKAEGCYAFTNTYCGINGNVTQAAGADTQFCDSMNAYRYCQQDGAANSPTCVERRVQAGTCQSDKAVDPSLECRIYNHQQLAQQVCQSYPSDPLCRRVLSSGSAYGSTAPNGGTPGAVSSGGNSGVMGYAMSSSSSSKVIPNNQRQPSSSGDVSCAACASVFSQISRVAQEYCQTGQLYGCYQK